MNSATTTRIPHTLGFESLVAEVITIAILDYKHKRLGEKANSARKDGREYAELWLNKSEAI